jgi:methyl-accepting chemotaxis protein
VTQYIPFWRRKFYVHPIQRKYFYLALVPLIVCACLLIILLFAPVFWALQGPSPDLDTAAALGQIYGPGGMRIWFAVIFSMLTACLLSFIATHKFAGPLYRIEQILRKVEDGNLPVSVQIRRDDDIQEFARALDSAFKTIAVALTAIKEQQARADAELVVLQGKVKAGLNGEILQGLEGISRNHRELESILANFNLPKPQAPTPEPTEK